MNKKESLPTEEDLNYLEKDSNSYNFLLLEYEKTFDSWTINYKSYERIVYTNKYLTAALISIAIFCLAKHENISIETDAKKLFLFFIIPFTGASFCISHLSSLLKCRNRDIWCYSRMNLIRRIFLSESSKLDSHIKYYIDSKYGSTHIFKFGKGKGLGHEWYYNAIIIELFLTLWIMISLSYFIPPEVLFFIFLITSYSLIFYSRKFFIKRLGAKNE